jgi:DNA replication protein DnaC
MNALDHILALPLTPIDEQRFRQLQLDRERQRLRDWWSTVRGQLPNWQYAHFGNREWLARIDGAAVAAVRRWDPLGGVGLVLCGPTGSGKSSAIVARLRDTVAELATTLERGGDLPRMPSVRWTTEEALMRDAYRWESDDDTIAWTKAQTRPRVFIIDEVGFAGGDRAPVGRTPALMALVNARYDAGAATSITTGLKPEELIARYGAALWRRLVERADVVDLFKEAKP